MSKVSKEQEKDGKNSAIDKALTNYARDLIKNPLGVPNYDKTRFQPKVNECKDHLERYLLDDESLAQNLAILPGQGERSPHFPPTTELLSSVAVAKEKPVPLLARVVTANVPILRLKENPAVERWVKDGRSLHKGRAPASSATNHFRRIDNSHLAGHFSADYEGLMAELKALVGKHSGRRNEEINSDLLQRRLLYSTYRNDSQSKRHDSMS